MKLTIDLADRMDCINGMEVVRHYYPELFEAKSETPTYMAEDEPVKDETPTPEPDVEDEVTEQHIADAEAKEEAAVAVTLDQLRAKITTYLKAVDPSVLMDEKMNIVGMLDSNFGVKTTDTLPEDKYDEAFQLVDLYIKEKA